MKSKERSRRKTHSVHKNVMMRNRGILVRVLAGILAVVVVLSSVPMDGFQVYAEEVSNENDFIADDTFAEMGQETPDLEKESEELDVDGLEIQDEIPTENENEIERGNLSEVLDGEEAISENTLISEQENDELLEIQSEDSISEADWAAGFSRGSGREDDPYIIIGVDQLQFFNQNYYRWPSAKYRYYALQSNINYAGKEWTPIDIVEGFDGKGYTISNVKIVADDNMKLNQYRNIAMFQSVGSLTDLKIDGAQIIDNRTSIDNSYIHYAVLCASNSRSSMTGCTVKGDIKLTINGSYSGTPSLSGLVGVNNGEIDDCIFSGTFFYLGNISGIAYQNNYSISHCVNRGAVNSPDGQIVFAGIVYENSQSGEINNCTNDSIILADQNASIISGIVNTNYGTLTGCYNNVELEGNIINGIARTSGNRSEISRCYNNGNLTGNTVNAICGTVSGSIYECTNSGILTGKTVSGCVGSINPSTGVNAEMRKCVNRGSVVASNKAAGILIEIRSNKGSITTVSQCSNEGDIVNEGGSGASGIVDSVTSDLNDSERTSLLLEKCSNSGMISSVNGSSTGIVRNISGSAAIVECFNEGTVTGRYSAGILNDVTPKSNKNQEQYSSPLISKCYNTGEIFAANLVDSYNSAPAGGIVGSISGGIVEFCYNSGDITGKDEVGGIIGNSQNYNADITISNCYNSGTVTATDAHVYATGGIIGRMSEYGGCNYSVDNCYSMGVVSGKNGNEDAVGQLFGSLWTSGGKGDYISVTGCYYSKNLGTHTGDDYDIEEEWLNSQGIYGVTTEDLKQQSTYKDWDFINNWSMGDEEYPYPILSCIGAGDAFKINYVLNGGKNNSNNVKKFYQEDEITLYPATKEGYRFEGWYTDLAYTSPIISFTGDIRKNITVYAKWSLGDQVIDKITINGSGYAYLWGILCDDNGSVLKNTKFDYVLYDITNPDSVQEIERNTLISSETDGSYSITTPKLENDSKTTTVYKEYKITLVVYGEGEPKGLGYVVNAEVAISPFSYSQSWELAGSVTGEAGPDLSIMKKEVGEATLEASLGSIGVNGNLGRRISVKIDTAGAKRDVSLKETYSSKMGGKFSFGPKLTVEVGDDKYSYPTTSLGAGIDYGTTISPELVLENYDPNNPEDINKLGAFLMNSMALSSGNVFLMSLATRTNGVDYVNALGDSYAFTLNKNAAAGWNIDKFGGFGISRKDATTKVLTYSTRSELEKLTESKTTSFKTDSSIETGVDKKILDIKTNSGAKFGSGSSFSVSAPHSSINDVPDVDWVSFTLSDSDTRKYSFLVAGEEKSATSKVTISYNDQAAKDICKNVESIGKFAYGDIRYILDSEYPKMIEQLNNSEAVGKYKVSKDSTTGASLEVPIKTAAFSLKLGCTGSYEEEYTSETGTYIQGVGQKQTEVNGKSVTGVSSSDVVGLLKDPFEYYYNLAAKALGEVKEYISNETEKVISKVNGKLEIIRNKTEETKNYMVHFLTTESDTKSKASIQAMSYEVPVVDLGEALSTQEVEDEAAETVFTVGYPYVVYLTDESEGTEGLEEEKRLLEAFPEGDTCTISMKYDLEKLQAAGISDINGGNLNIYMYSDEYQGYECLGGTRDYDNQSVSVVINKPGQYILAIDNDIPVVRGIEISDHSSTPEIKVSIDEKSGFSDLSFKIDENEIINENNYRDYYSASKGTLIYIIDEEEALADGIHTVSIFAVDAAGNRMPEPVVVEFAVHNVKPEIAEAMCYTEGNTLRIRAKFKEFGDVFDESVYLEDVEDIAAEITEMYKPEGEGEPVVETTAIQLGAAGKERYITGIGERKLTKGKVIKFTIIITDINGNKTEKEFSTDEGTVIEGSAENDLWYYMPQSIQGYTGTAIKPIVYVFDGNKLLTEKKDYTISYKNNTNAYKYTDGSDVAKRPNIIVTGKGNYSQKDYIYFDIEKKDLTDSDIVIADILTTLTTGKQQKPTTTVVWNKKKLSVNKDYKITYCKKVNDNPYDIDAEERIIPEAAGDYFAIIEAVSTGNYQGRILKAFTIADKDKYRLISKVKVGKIKDKPYTGLAVLPEEGELIVSDGKTLQGIEKTEYDNLADNEKDNYDYTYEYFDTVQVGVASVKLTGVGRYVGTKTVTYKITGVPISKATISSNLIKKNDFVYDGTKHILTDLDLSYKANKNAEIIKLAGIENKAYDRLSESDENKKTYNYTYEYQNNVNAGTATVVLTGINGFTGTVKKTFKIAKYSIKKDAPSLVKAKLETKSYSFTYGGVMPKPIVTYLGRNLVEGKDYNLAYSNNKAVNDGSNIKKLPTVTVKPIGNFAGVSLLCNFTIAPTNLNEDGLTATASDKVFAEKKGAWKSVVSVVGPDGKKLAAKGNYSAKLEYRYESFSSEEENEPVSGCIVKNIKNTKAPTYEWRNVDDIVDEFDIVPAGTTIKVVLTGEGNYAEELTTTYRVVKYDIGKLTVIVNNGKPYTYTTNEIKIKKSDIVIKNGKIDITSDVTFTIDDKSYKNNTNKGKASVTLKGYGEYGGSKTVNYTIGNKLFQWWKK